MASEIEKNAKDWMMLMPGQLDIKNESYCETRDIFQARLDKMLQFLQQEHINEQLAYFVYSIFGEIGNNSFDHNIGHWQDLPGIFFAFNFTNDRTIALADRGQGILNSLKKVKPALRDDVEALRTAFNEKISGRAPENRGNGLKYVKNIVMSNNMHLDFFSGYGYIRLNSGMAIDRQETFCQGCLAILKF
jgi:hypothetical protein